MGKFSFPSLHIHDVDKGTFVHVDNELRSHVAVTLKMRTLSPAHAIVVFDKHHVCVTKEPRC